MSTYALSLARQTIKGGFIGTGSEMGFRMGLRAFSPFSIRDKVRFSKFVHGRKTYADCGNIRGVITGFASHFIIVKVLGTTTHPSAPPLGAEVWISDLDSIWSL